MLDFPILTLVCWGRSHLLIHTHLNCSVMLPRASLGTCWVAWRKHATWNLADGVGSFFYPKIKLVFYPFLFWGCKVIYDIKFCAVRRRFRPDYTFCGQFLFHIIPFQIVLPQWNQHGSRSSRIASECLETFQSWKFSVSKSVGRK